MNAGYLRLETHIQNMYYLLPFHGKNGYANAPVTLYVHIKEGLEYVELVLHRPYSSHCTLSRMDNFAFEDYRISGCDAVSYGW